MAKSAQQKIHADFSGGYITDGNILSYPDNAASEMINFNVKDNGSLHKRLGLAYDSSTFRTMPDPIDGVIPAVNVFKWENAGGSDISLAVVQVGNRLDFYFLAESGITENNPAAASIIIGPTPESKIANSALVYSNKIYMAAGGGRLFIAGKFIRPAYLTYEYKKEGLSTIEYQHIDIKIRDFEVWKEGETNVFLDSVAGEVRQGRMSAYHQYNLYNQGWPDRRDITPFTDVGEAPTTVSSEDNPDTGVEEAEPAAYTKLQKLFFPSTADTIHAYQAGDGDTVSKQQAFSPWRMVNDYSAFSKAGRGHSILDCFIRVRSGRSSDDLVATEEVRTEYRPEAVAFYAGRVWYAGTQGEGFLNEIYFSQIFNNALNKVGNCHQEADPTAEVINELVASDGGVISIPEMGKVLKMIEFRSSLLIFTTKGIWAISGDGEISTFSATSFSVTKISDIAAINSDSISVAKDSIFYAGVSSLLRLGVDERGNIGVADISSTKVKTYYQSLSLGQKALAFVVYDEGQSRVYLHHPSAIDEDNLTIDPINDKVLYYDVDLDCFGKYSIETGDVNDVSDGLQVSLSTSLLQVLDVVASGDSVVVGTDNVSITNRRTIVDKSSAKLLILNREEPNTYIFASYEDREFKDFGNYFNCALESGFDSLGDLIGDDKRAPITSFNFERTEDGYILNPEDPEGIELILDKPSSCLLSYKWDWGETPFSNEAQAYKFLRNYIPEALGDTFKYDRGVITTKLRIRGRGTSLGFHIRDEDGKDLRLLGYSVVYVGDAA